MKKMILFCIIIFTMLSAYTVTYAGDIPESALNYDDSRVYLGEVKEKKDKDIIVIQRANIKGEFTQNTEIKYKNHYVDLAVGQTYIFVDFMGYKENNIEIEDNSVYSFDLESFDLKDASKTKLFIDNIFDTSDMAVRMQEYIDNKDFEKAEKERLERKASGKSRYFYGNSESEKEEKTEKDDETELDKEKTKDYVSKSDENKIEDDKNFNENEIRKEKIIIFIVSILLICLTVYLRLRKKKK